jgi:hypothetical protein
MTDRFDSDGIIPGDGHDDMCAALGDDEGVIRRSYVEQMAADPDGGRRRLTRVLDRLHRLQEEENK